MPERSIVITPTLTNAQLREIPNWRTGTSHARVETAFLGTLNQLTAGKVNWDDVLRQVEQAGSGFKSTKGALARESAVKIASFAQIAGWDYHDPRSVLCMGIFGQEKVGQIAVRHKKRLEEIGTASYTDEDLRAQSQQRAREALLVYDNDNPDSPGAKQIVDSSINTFIKENPELTDPHLQGLLKRLVNIKEFARFIKPKKRLILAALESGQFDQATIILNGAK